MSETAIKRRRHKGYTLTELEDQKSKHLAKLKEKAAAFDWLSKQDFDYINEELSIWRTGGDFIGENLLDCVNQAMKQED